MVALHLCEHRERYVSEIRTASHIDEIPAEWGDSTVSSIVFRRSCVNIGIGRSGTERLTGKIAGYWEFCLSQADEAEATYRQGYRSMHLLFRFSIIVALGTCFTLLPAPLKAQEPGWTSRVLKVGPERELSEQTPILERPYRPLHFYGNAVRRNYYRGNPLPLPRDILITGAFLAPSSRDRDLEREQRFGGYDYRRPEAEDSDEQEDKEDAGPLAIELDPQEEPKSEEPSEAVTRADEGASTQANVGRESSRRQGLDAQARRSRRGN